MGTEKKPSHIMYECKMEHYKRWGLFTQAKGQT